MRVLKSRNPGSNDVKELLLCGVLLIEHILLSTKNSNCKVKEVCKLSNFLRVSHSIQTFADI